MYHFQYTIFDMNEWEISDPIDFEWDRHNQSKIRLKHGITTEEAEQVFFNHPVISRDILHSSTEQRCKLIGPTDLEKILMLVFTIRNHKLRIISARRANKKERDIYAKQIKENS